MARYDHLELVRLPEQYERRKPGGFGGAPPRDVASHSAKLKGDLDVAVAAERQRRRPEFIDPSLVLRVQMTGSLLEEDWEKLGLTVLSSEHDRTLVLFASADDLRDFRARLDAWQRGAPPGQKAPPYHAFMATIEAIGSVEPSDRIGMRLRAEGFATVNDFADAETYTVDLELWDIGGRPLRERKLKQITAYVEAHAGEVVDQYLGPSITMARLRISGAVIKTLLAIPEIDTIDLLPQPDQVAAETIALTLPNVPERNAVAGDAPLIGIIDSGINDHPFLADIIVGAIGVPPELGTADDWGHGTRVAGIAVFGDIRAQLAAGTLNRGARLCAAKVVNHAGQFHEQHLVPAQMRDALFNLNRQFGCRIFVIPLADKTRPYDYGKVGAWAATLDELARELNILIIVSAGNRYPRGGEQLEESVTAYPHYLLEAANRFFEPAGAMNILTVGALAHGEGLDGDLAEDVRARPITKALEPAPFSRVGPGIGGAIKPDLVDVGDTLVFDPLTAKLRGGEDRASAGVVTLHHRFVDRLFTAGSGTSYAAPRVAFSAAQILQRFPQASANLLRALLVGSASVTEATDECLRGLGPEAVSQISGHGLIDLERAAYSDDARVVLYTEDVLPLDHFAVYRIPIPEPFRTEKGARAIRVTLAYDPPVRHTRTDYTGVGMSFRLIRGCSSDLIFEHYRKRTREEGEVPDLAGRFNCGLVPGPQIRERGTIQTATATFKKALDGYGEDYYLVVRCESGWAKAVAEQRFAVVVEISHQAQVVLYERIRQRIRLGR